MSRKESYEGSEEERWQKAIAKCRNCGHVRMAHSFLNKKSKCLDSCLFVTGKYKSCPCLTYEPKDNLEFLEFRYDEKKKGKDK
jgi:hypothetical protein